MSLVIEPGLYRKAVVRDLGRLVPPSVWSMDDFGFISVNAPPMAARSVLLLAEVARVPGLLRIAGSEAAAASASKGNAIQLRDVGGQTFFDPAAQGEDADVVIFYDTTNNYGNGYWVHGLDGSQIDFPTHILLGHELAHAAQVFDKAWTDEASGEAFAIAAENALRAADSPVLPARLGHDGGAKSPPKKTPPPPPGRSRGCFVATASLGSPDHPSLRDLRELRDELLQRSRAGRELYDGFNDRYRALSIPVIAAMADPETRELVRDWVVRPVMRYLELIRDFPDLPAEAAGPWAPFLERLRDDLERFASAVPLPGGLGSLEPAEAVEELLVALRYQLRSPDRRRVWLEELRRRGELPVAAGDARERAALAERLRAAGRTAEEIDLVLAPVGLAADVAATASLAGFGPDLGTTADTVAWRYTVTLRNATTDETYLNLRVYYLAAPGDADSMGLVTLDDLKPGEVAVFPLCECTRLQSYFIEGDIVTAAGDTGQFVYPDQGSMTPAAAGDAFPCEDSWAF